MSSPRAVTYQARIRGALFLAISVAWGSMPIESWSQSRPTGFDMGALPAINFDADEGFGYGAFAELYQYGDGTFAPYLWTLQPSCFSRPRAVES